MLTFLIGAVIAAWFLGALAGLATRGAKSVTSAVRNRR